MFAPIRIIAPVAPLVSVEEAKRHLRVDHADEDLVIAACVAAATERLDGWSGILGRALATQTWRQDYAGWCDVMRLPLHPVASITQVTYLDADGATQTLASSAYVLLRDALGAFVTFKPGESWPALGPTHAPVSVTYVAGEPAEAVPSPIRAAILLMAGDLYRFRETAALGVSTSAIPMSTTVEALIASYRRTTP
jgi:uncharacterized phiE125 gp8 family phage protein